jgi:hypothetical protein
MDDRAHALRRRIAVYRRYLAEGMDEALAAEYHCQIAEDQAELERLELSCRANEGERSNDRTR